MHNGNAAEGMVQTAYGLDSGPLRDQVMNRLQEGLNTPTTPGALNIPESVAPRPLSINKLLRGWIVQVGCQAIAFETLEKTLSEVGRYLRNPGEVEKEYLNQKA